MADNIQMAKKKKNKGYSSKTNVKKPNALFNAFILAGVRTWLRRRVKLTVKCNVGKLERPSIVLCKDRKSVV